MIPIISKEFGAMKMSKFLTVFVLTAMFACRETRTELRLDHEIIGTWIVVVTEKDYSSSALKWGDLNAGAIRLYDDNTFKVNVVDDEDDARTPKHGTWKLANNGTIIFNTEIDGFFGNVERFTSEFTISMRDDDNLVLEGDGVKTLLNRFGN